MTVGFTLSPLGESVSFAAADPSSSAAGSVEAMKTRKCKSVNEESHLREINKRLR
jgi:hypothetical protein